MTGGVWDDYCRGSNDVYEQHELDELNAAYTGQQILADTMIQSLLNELGSRTLPLEVSNSEYPDDWLTIRHNTRSLVNSALEFIFSTPFVFGEGGQ